MTDATYGKRKHARNRKLDSKHMIMLAPNVTADCADLPVDETDKQSDDVAVVGRRVSSRQQMKSKLNDKSADILGCLEEQVKLTDTKLGRTSKRKSSKPCIDDHNHQISVVNEKEVLKEIISNDVMDEKYASTLKDLSKWHSYMLKALIFSLGTCNMLLVMQIIFVFNCLISSVKLFKYLFICLDINIYI